MKTTDFLSRFNSKLVRASRLADALMTLADSYRHALALDGVELIDLRDKPNAQASYALTEDAKAAILARGERLPRRVSPKTFDEADLRVSKLPVMPTALDSDEVRVALASILALKSQARVIDFLARKRDRRALDLAPAVLSTLDVAVSTLEALDPALTEYAVREFDKAHVSDFDEAADLDVSGSHWTSSDKGDATTIRYDESREVRGNAKADHHAAGLTYSLDEDALLAELADLDSES